MNISNFLTIVHLSTLFKTGDLISWPWFISFLVQITNIFTCMELVFFFKVKKIVDTTHVDRSQRQLSHSFEGFPDQKDTMLKTRAR